MEAQQVMSDFQDLVQTDLGNVTQLVSGFAPGSDVVIFCERGIYTASFTGPPLIFQFRIAQGASGTMAPRSVVVDHARDQSGAVRPVCYYLSSDGFAAFDGSASYPVGAQKWDALFWRELDDQYLTYVQGIRDPRSRSVIWAYPTVGSNGLMSRLFVYNWELSRASYIDLDPPLTHVEWLTVAMYGTSYNLDNIDGLGDLDTIQPSFDDPFWTGNMASRLSFFDRDHRLVIGGGPAMAPTLETAEMQPNDGRRAWVRLTRPLNDGTPPRQSRSATASGRPIPSSGSRRSRSMRSASARSGLPGDICGSACRCRRGKTSAISPVLTSTWCRRASGDDPYPATPAAAVEAGRRGYSTPLSRHLAALAKRSGKAGHPGRSPGGNPPRRTRRRSGGV